MRVLLLPPLFLPPLEVYDAMREHDLVVIDTAMRYDKRAKSAHRTVIADAHGELTLTVPVTRPHGINHPTWDDVTISAHNEWWRAMTGAITTAYSPLPYFMHLWPEFAPLISEQSVGMSVVTLDTRLDATVRRLLGITTPATTTLPPALDTLVRAKAPTPGHTITDLRQNPPTGISVLAHLFATRNL